MIRRATMMTLAVVALFGTLTVPSAGQSRAMPPTRTAMLTPDEALAAAREDLRLSQLTFAHILSQLERFRGQADVDPAILEDYLRYLEAVRGMTVAQQRIVEEMEAAHPELVEAPAPEWTSRAPQVFVPPIPVSYDEELSPLDRELERELEKFDAYLLEEQHEAARRMARIEEEGSEEMTDLAREAAAAVERLRKKGIEVDTSPPREGPEGQDGRNGPSGQAGGGAPGESSSPGGQGEESPGGTGSAGGTGAAGGAAGGAEGPTGEGAAGATGSGENAGGEGSEGAGAGGSGESGEGGAGEGEGPASGGASGAGEGAASGSGSGASGSGGTPQPSEGGPSGSGGGEDTSPSVPGDRPPADDDDIVARQLREAAEKEKDPVLREKLWKEYDKYKGNA